jgi:DNA-binding GntR family transcriptional regulator
MLTTPDKRLALQAYEQVLDMIMSGHVKPGTLIQERRLADHLQMSRTPLRDGLLMLESEGLLVRQGSRGLQVRLMNVAEFVDTLAIRRLLEPEAARIAAGRIPAETVASLSARLEALLAQAGSTKAPARNEVRSVDDALHGAISEAAGNPQMAAIIRTLRRQTQMFDLRSMPERFESTCREHLAILLALEAADGAEAANAMRTHLDCVRQSIIDRLARI